MATTIVNNEYQFAMKAKYQKSNIMKMSVSTLEDKKASNLPVNRIYIQDVLRQPIQF
jgi:hypothetical protein